jgi:hypothetical protein
MFPCNFLSYLRSKYSENNKDNQLVFVHTIRPMLNTVRMHPLLVTHSRDQEKTPTRWKTLELHDVIVESSRYSLISQESTKEDQEPPILETGGVPEVTPGNDIELIFVSARGHHNLYIFYIVRHSRPLFRAVPRRHPVDSGSRCRRFNSFESAATEPASGLATGNGHRGHARVHTLCHASQGKCSFVIIVVLEYIRNT